MIDRLIQILPPPEAAAEPALSWEDLERLAGLVFAAPVRAFFERYGAGAITGPMNGSLDVHDPRRGNVVTRTNDLGAMRVHRAAGNREDVVGGLAFAPERGGLFPIAGNGNGDSVWVDDGRTVVVFDGDETERFVFEGTWTAFLVQLLEGEELTGIFGVAKKKKKSAFKPFEKKVVVQAKLAGGTSLPTHAAALRALLGTVKVERDATDSVEYRAAWVTVALTEVDARFGGDFTGLFSSWSYPADREGDVRRLFDRFVAEQSLSVVSLADFAGSPVWADRDAALVPTPSIERIMAAALPPSVPVRADWSKVATLLGSALPPDFGALMRAYGTGSFGSLRIAPPESTVRAWLEILPGLHPIGPGLGIVPFVWSGVTVGLLPIGECPEGLSCWDTAGAPHAWKTVFLAGFRSATPAVHRHDGGLASFLAAALAGELPFLRLAPTFTPG